MACRFADGIAMREPMFECQSFRFPCQRAGFPFAALIAGTSLALPTRQTDPESLAALIETVDVTMATPILMSICERIERAEIPAPPQIYFWLLLHGHLFRNFLFMPSASE
jgi:hypothetical protein